jgi:serine O-acetyltransferase
MKYPEYLSLVKADLFRYTGKVNLSVFFIQMMINPGFKYTFWMRTCNYLSRHRFLKILFFIPSRLVLDHYQYKYGISISYRTVIGSGIYISHFGGIVINSNAVLGKNCNLSHEVTIGQANRGRKKGCPILGDNIFIGPGAKIIGNVRIGNNVAIGSNCVVTKDIEDNAVVVGIPGQVISDQGSEGYIAYTNYDDTNKG